MDTTGPDTGRIGSGSNRSLHGNLILSTRSLDIRDTDAPESSKAGIYEEVPWTRSVRETQRVAGPVNDHTTEPLGAVAPAMPVTVAV